MKFLSSKEHDIYTYKHLSDVHLFEGECSIGGLYKSETDLYILSDFNLVDTDRKKYFSFKECSIGPNTVLMYTGDVFCKKSFITQNTYSFYYKFLLKTKQIYVVSAFIYKLRLLT